MCLCKIWGFVASFNWGGSVCIFTGFGSFVLVWELVCMCSKLETIK